MSVFPYTTGRTRIVKVVTVPTPGVNARRADSAALPATEGLRRIYRQGTVLPQQVPDDRACELAGVLQVRFAGRFSHAGGDHDIAEGEKRLQ